MKSEKWLFCLQKEKSITKSIAVGAGEVEDRVSIDTLYICNYTS